MLQPNCMLTVSVSARTVSDCELKKKKRNGIMPIVEESDFNNGRNKNMEKN